MILFSRRVLIIGCGLLLVAGLFFSTSTLAAMPKKEVVYLVGADEAAAKAAAGRVGGTAVGSLTKAFAAAVADLSAGSNVTIKLAGGEYTGDFGSGAYALGVINAPTATLKLEGGFKPDFSSRSPFRLPSMIVATPQRSAPLLKFAANSKLGAFIVDGVSWDSQASNSYDAKTNSLLYGKSCTFPFVQFYYLETNLLVFQNCVIANSANRAIEPLIRAATPEAEIRFSNCIIFNNRIPLKLDSARFRNKPARIVVDHCSFLINWAYNPDPETSNPASLEIGAKDAAGEIVITNNLFYSNFGGAILALGGPPMVVSNNNFVGNGLLHGQSESDAVAMIISAGGRKQPISLGMIGDVPLVKEGSGNVSITPGIPLALDQVKTVDSSTVKAEASWQNEVRRLLGMNLQGGRVEIKNYAPKKEYDPANPPFPTKNEAEKYGAQLGNAR